MEVAKMSDIRHLVRDIQRLIKAIRREALILRKDKRTKFRIKYVWGGKEDFKEYITSDGEKAAAWFLDDAQVPPEIRNIVGDVIVGEKWFEIVEVGDDVEATNTWTKVFIGPERDIYLSDEGVFEIDGKKYKVEKDKHLKLDHKDVERLVRAGLTKLSADAVEEDYWSSADRADDEWKERP
jgi:hypothetical protein